MPRPPRTPKAVAQRIDRQYFKKGFRLPRWRTRLTIIAALAATAWIVWRTAVRDHTAFSTGPLDSHHAMFNQKCDACHVQKAGLTTTVTDQACLTCHDGPIHHEQQVSTPKCADCHVEHMGAPLLLGAGDKTCTKCHSALQTKAGKLTVASHIESFSDGHPEFTALRPSAADPGTIKFNHKVHMKPGLKGPHGNVQLICADCHRPTDINQPWPYGEAGAAVVPVSADPQSSKRRISRRAYMQPVNYYQHCSSCHPLAFDRRIAEVAPHKKADMVIAFMQEKFEAYIAAHPEELQPRAVPVRIPRAGYEAPPRTASAWVSKRMAESEHLLWTKTCAECHAISGIGVLPTPKVEEGKLTIRWMPHSEFDHGAHQMVDCESCHRKTKSSEKTSDVLLPGIRICQDCHNQTAHASAGAQCFECHRYHDWSKEKPRHGHLPVPKS